MVILFLLLIGINSVIFAQARHPDRDWDFGDGVTLNGAAKRVTNTQSGALWIQNKGADAYISFNATADATTYDAYIPNGGSANFYPASIRFGEYFTLYSAGSTRLTYVILD